ncbi:hypothetical protein PENSPDRAFT_668101 [Peniophora sp. CONT]|nr:hypothetical protein PENSPDRAFT_668101 [Peniophora sp. CONT]
MLFSALMTAAAALLGPASATPIEKRQATLCVLGIHEIVQDRRFVLPLARQCLTQIPDGTQFWNYPTCVAAAITTGVDQLTDLGYCQTNITAPPAPTELPVLNQTIFDSMATTCADDGTCGISEQNFVDFIYGQIESNGMTVTPDSVAQLKKYYIQPVFDFTNTSNRDAVSYDSFNTWLHNSSYGVHYGSDTTQYNTHLN